MLINTKVKFPPPPFVLPVFPLQNLGKSDISHLANSFVSIMLTITRRTIFQHQGWLFLFGLFVGREKHINNHKNIWCSNKLIRLQFMAGCYDDCYRKHKTSTFHSWPHHHHMLPSYISSPPSNHDHHQS